MKKYLLLITIAVVAFLTGCQTTPKKLIASSAATVDGAMKAWAIYVVDGHATEAQRVRVRELQTRYYAAEDAMLVAVGLYEQFGDDSTWRDSLGKLVAAENELVSFVVLITGKDSP